MKKKIVLMASFAVSCSCFAQVTSWENSPFNYNNSQYNYNANNGVYDNQENRIGYEVQSPQGVTNVFDNNGNRIGYSPSKR